MKICVPVKEKSQAKVMKVLSEVSKSADLAEVWIDQIEDLDLKSLIKNSPVPLVCACKRTEEGGLFSGTYNQMADLLIQAILCGAEYIDIPISMPELLNKKIVQHRQMSDVKGQMLNVKCQRSKVIISHHDFQKTPDDKTLQKIVGKMLKRGADVVKIAVTAKSDEDSLSIIFLAKKLKSEGIPHILIAMGKKGILTRVITPFLGGEMMFAPLKKSSSTASGQLTVGEIKKVWGMIGIQL